MHCDLLSLVISFYITSSKPVTIRKRLDWWTCALNRSTVLTTWLFRAITFQNRQYSIDRVPIQYMWHLNLLWPDDDFKLNLFRLYPPRKSFAWRSPDIIFTPELYFDDIWTHCHSVSRFILLNSYVSVVSCQQYTIIHG